jgi:phospholipase C
MESIYNAQFKKLPNAYKALSPTEIAQINDNPLASTWMPKQEPGTRPSCPIPYELSADGAFNTAKNSFEIKLKAKNGTFRDKAAGAPFVIYAPGKYKNEQVRVWNYAVKAGDALTGSWKPEDFEGGKYHLRVYGPNGFFREFQGDKASGKIKVGFEYHLDRNQKPTGNVRLRIEADKQLAGTKISIKDNAYQTNSQEVKLQAQSSSDLLAAETLLDLQASSHWYDFSIQVDEQPDFLVRYAGHVETGQLSTSDPLMGQLLQS